MNLTRSFDEARDKDEIMPRFCEIRDVTLDLLHRDGRVEDSWLGLHPREFELPDVGWITIEDSETGRQVELNSSDNSIRRGYKELATGRKKELHRLIHSCGIDILDLSTDKSYIPPLLSFFGTRKRRLSR